MWPTVFFALALAAACGARPERARDSARAHNAGSPTVASQERLREMNLAAPTLVEPLGEQAAAARENRFVRVEVVNVVNAKRLPVTVRVDYAPATGKRVHLGSFSLFPSDRPGTFIVATQGRVNGGGAIVLSLEKPAAATASDTVRITIRPITFVNR